MHHTVQYEIAAEHSLYNNEHNKSSANFIWHTPLRVSGHYILCTYLANICTEPSRLRAGVAGVSHIKLVSVTVSDD
jgi:hypothetical protein